MTAQHSRFRMARAYAGVIATVAAVDGLVWLVLTLSK